ncbi:MAG: hypothetical protein K2O03_02155 [Lachnospiraceae bacterium]|nr:hypothetical protein [Lachnospiraceae bacterium]
MRKQENYWKRFEQTGGVMDYLNYTACARESYGMPDTYDMAGSHGLRDLYPEEDDEEDEVEEDDWDAHREWDGTFGYADGRIR